jgi:hypothetical protein
MSEEALNRLHRSIVDMFADDNRLGIRNQNDMILLLPADLMLKGLGEEIVYEINCVAARDVAQFMSWKLADLLKKQFPNAYIQEIER